MKAFLNKKSVQDRALETVSQSKGRLGCLMDLPLGYPSREWCNPVLWTIGQIDSFTNLCFQYESELGIPGVLAALEFKICQGLPCEQAKAFPANFLQAIRPGADLRNVWLQFAAWRLDDPAMGVIRFATSEAVSALVRRVSAMCRDGITAVKAWESMSSMVRQQHDQSHAVYAMLSLIDVQLSSKEYFAKMLADSIQFVAFSVTVAASFAGAPYATAEQAQAVRKSAQENEHKLMHDKLLEILQAA